MCMLDLQSVSDSGDVNALRELLKLFKTCACTFRNYTDLGFRLDTIGLEDLHDFTLLSLDAYSTSVPSRTSLDSSSQASSNRQTGSSSTHAFFSMVAEGAGKALNAFLTAGEQFLGVSSPDSVYFEADLLARRTRNVAAQLTQRFLNSMLIA